MADDPFDDPELKDEELVDFEGSDYDLGSDDEELDEESETEIVTQQTSDEALQKRPIISEQTPDLPASGIEEGPVLRSEDSNFVDLQKPSTVVSWNNEDAAQSVQIEQERDEKTSLDAPKKDFPAKIGENRQRKQRKPDLEDGELDDTVMPEGFNIDTEGKVKVEIIGQKRKRRKDRFAMERQTEDFQGNDAKELEEISCSAARQQHNRVRIMEHLAGLARSGGRGVNMRMMGFGQASGIMGPAGLLMPFGVRSLGRGFGPLGGVMSHGRPNVHFQEVLAQERLLRARAMQLARGSIAGAVRSPMTGPLGIAALRPFLGFDFAGPGSPNLMPFQQQPTDFVSHGGFMGPLDNFVRVREPIVPAGRAHGSSKGGGTTESSSGSGLGRQCGWPAVPMSAETQHLGRGRAHGRGLSSSSWEEARAMGPVLGGQGSAVGHINSGRVFDGGAGTQVMARNIQNTSSNNVSRFGQSGLCASQADRITGLNEFDAICQIAKERISTNDMDDGGILTESAVGASHDFRRDDNSRKSEANNSVLEDPPADASTAAESTSTLQANSTASVKVSSPSSTVGSTVIQLLQPKRKSRILIVGGLPENTPMSTIVEAFEKLGKVVDFKNGQKGGAFTVSYSTETEAVTAKRFLHRSFLAGRQITVDYAYQ